MRLILRLKDRRLGGTGSVDIETNFLRGEAGDTQGIRQTHGVSVTPEAIQAAATRTIARTTPLERSERLSETHGADVFLKREDLQLGRSYKVRGAYHTMSSLAPDELAVGVVAASAGNHAQGIAISCARLGAKGRIFVPTNTPRQKRDRILALGGSWVELTLIGRTYDEASAAAHATAEESGATYIHPFDDERTIIGQGTVGYEITHQVDQLDALVVPIGGGGLVSGIATWAHAAWPDTRIIGVEPAGAASMQASLTAGGPVTLESLDTFVDGASVATAGSLTYPLVRDLVDEVISVEVGAVCAEMLELYQVDGIIAEPAGALASTALPQVSDLGRVAASSAAATTMSPGTPTSWSGPWSTRAYGTTSWCRSRRSLARCAVSSTRSCPMARTSWSSSTSRSPTARPGRR